MKKIINFIEYLLILILIIFFKILPVSSVGIVSKLLLYPLYFLGIRKKIIEKNYSYVFNRKPNKEFYTKFYHNFLITFLETIFMLAKPNTYLSKLYKKINNVEDVKNAKNPIIITMHFSNWEATGSYFGLNFYDIYPAFKKQSNEYVEKLLNKIRKKYNLNPIYSDEIVKETVKNPKRIFAFLIDQNLRQGKYYKFLGKQTLITNVPVRLAVKQKRDIIYGYSVRENENYIKVFKISFGKDENIDNIMNNILDEFSKIIFQYPYLWYGWWHRLWKTTPKNGGIYDKK